MLDQHWTSASDQDLLRACRHGDPERFALLWERHRPAGMVAARHIAPGLEAEDLVSEAYLRIFELVSDGRGPEGAFRPYLYQVIRSIAADRLRSPEQSSAELDRIPDLHEAGPWEDKAFDLNAAARAFESLPERWQSVLWYTEVEGLPPRRVALMLGISANAVSALSARAREGLQSAWVEAHVDMQVADEACRETLERLQRHQRRKLTARANREVEAHLRTCESCAAAAAELSTLNHKLALVLGTVVVGGGAAGLLGQIGVLGAGGGAAAGGAAAGASSAQGAGAGGAGAAGAGGAGAAGAGAGVGVATIAIAATIAAAVAIGGGVLLVSTLTSGSSHSPASEVPPTAEKPPPAVDDDDEQEETSEDLPSEQVIAEAVAPPQTQQTRRPPAPTPTPPAPTPIDPGEPDMTVPWMQPGFDCYISGGGPGTVQISGYANSYGVIQARITDGSSDPVPVMDPSFDPLHPSTLFVDGVFDDTRGNRFTQGFLTGTDAFPGQGPHVQPDPEKDSRYWWWADQSITPLTQWGFDPSLGLGDVLFEIRLLTPSGYHSPWTAITTFTECGP